MPGYHCVVGAKAIAGGCTMFKASVCPGYMQAWSWSRPICAFDMPMNTLTQQGDVERLSYEEYLAELSLTPDPWWIARVYGD